MRILRLLYRDLRTGGILRGSPTTLIITLVYPLVYIFVVGVALGGVIRQIELGGQSFSYPRFLIPGIVASQAMFAASWAAARVWFDRRSGMLEQILVMPFSRIEYLISKLLALLIHSLVRTLVIFLVALPLLLGVDIKIPSLLEMIGALLLGALLFGSLSLSFCSFIQTQETFSIVMNSIMPLLVFFSSVFYPLQYAPSALQIIMFINPLTHVADLTRAGLLGIYEPHLMIGAILLPIEAIIFLVIAMLAFRRLGAKL